MKRSFIIVMCLVSVLLVQCRVASARTLMLHYLVKAADPPDMTLRVIPGPGQQFKEAQLAFDPPETRDLTITAKAPQDHAAHWDAWQPWPGKYEGKMVALNIKPQTDSEGTLILGGLFRQIRTESITIKSANGSGTFRQGRDYKVNPVWGQIGNIKGRLGQPLQADLKISYRLALQRLDLVQVTAQGKVTVKKGASRIVCPQLPEPDAGCTPLAGVYIAPWEAARNPWFDESGGLKAATKFAITQREIFVVNPAPPVEPINATAVARTWQKLRDGKEARIAFMGASITLGAEAPAWWDNLWTEKNLGYPSRVVVSLRRRFPKATVTPIEAFQGGTTTKYGLKMVDEKVVPAKADLLLIAFGGNDVAGPEGRPPNNPPEKFKEDMRVMVRKAKENGMEVMLVVTMQQNPWQQAAKRWPAYRKALIDLAREENVACADVYSEWMNQASRGIPPFTQLHNWINHPGKEGHKIYADVILRFFEAK